MQRSKASREAQEKPTPLIGTKDYKICTVTSQKHDMKLRQTPQKKKT